MVGSTTCQLKVYFTTVYHFPATPNGWIKVTLPSDITLTGTTCSATVDGQLATCIGSSLTDFIITHSLTSSVAAKAVVITFNDFKQPLSMKPTTSITVYTQEYETEMFSSGLTANYFSIDGTTEQLTFVSDTPNAVLSASIIWSVTTTGSDATFTVSF